MNKENTDIDPDKYKSCKKYECIPGGSSKCSDNCTNEQMLACFNKFEEESNKDTLPK